MVPDAVEFMAQLLRRIQTEAGNSTIGSGKQHGDGDDDDSGSDIYLLLLNDKFIYAEGLFINLDRPHGGVPVTKTIMAG